MKRTLRGVLVAVVAAGAMVAVAQAQSTTSQKKTSDSKSVTLTGCVQAGTMADTFLLTDVTQTAGPTLPGIADSGSGGALELKGTSGRTSSVELMSGSGVDLKAHVGHKVEITGMPQAPKKAASSGAGSGMAGTSGSTTPSVRVESLRHLADACSGQ
jgi:hypothetical protein